MRKNWISTTLVTAHKTEKKSITRSLHRWSRRCYSVGLTVASVGLAVTRALIERRSIPSPNQSSSPQWITASMPNTTTAIPCPLVKRLQPLHQSLCNVKSPLGQSWQRSEKKLLHCISYAGLNLHLKVAFLIGNGDCPGTAWYRDGHSKMYEKSREQSKILQRIGWCPSGHRTMPILTPSNVVYVKLPTVEMRRAISVHSKQPHNTCIYFLISHMETTVMIKNYYCAWEAAEYWDTTSSV